MSDKDNKIAIIGGGLSGLFTAYNLQKKGYKKVTVFEREDRIGGKLNTIWYKGKSYELGAIFGLPSYLNLRYLMNELNIKVDGPKLSRTNYNGDGNKIMPIPKEDLTGFLEELERLPKVLSTYKSLQSPCIKDLEPRLMLPFSEWCDIHQFEILKTIYVHYFTIFGLGNIDEVPALYVLRIMNYDHLMSFMQIPEFYTWKDGVSTLTEHLGKKVNNIRLGQEVKDISLSPSGSLYVQTQFEKLEFNKVIITAPLDQFSSLQFWDEDMKNYLNSIKYQYFNVYAFIVDKVPRGCGCILDNLSTDRRGHITIWDSRWDISENEEMVVLYAYNPPKDSGKTPLEIIKEDLSRLGVKDSRLYQAKRWKHCPYVDTNTLRMGFYDKMGSMQGKNNVFLSGEIMSMLSIENSLWYSKDLVERYF